MPCLASLTGSPSAPSLWSVPSLKTDLRRRSYVSCSAPRATPLDKPNGTAVKQRCLRGESSKCAVAVGYASARCVEPAGATARRAGPCLYFARPPREVGSVQSRPRVVCSLRCFSTPGADLWESPPKSRPHVDSSPRRPARPRVESELIAIPRDGRALRYVGRSAPVRRPGGQSPGASFVLVSRLRPCPAPRRASRASQRHHPEHGHDETDQYRRGQLGSPGGARRPSRAER